MPLMLYSIAGVEIPGWIPGILLVFALTIAAAYVKSLFDMRRARAANRRIVERQEERLRKSAEARARGEYQDSDSTVD